MTLEEAIQMRVEKIRLPSWNEWAYIKLNYDEQGHAYAVAELYDVGCVARPVLTPTLRYEKLWESWKEPADYEARKNEIYVEVL